MAQGDLWTPFGGSWQVRVGQSCELRFIVMPKGGKVTIRVTVGGDPFDFSCESGDEAITAYFRLSVF
jgi:hypothetical protein